MNITKVAGSTGINPTVGLPAENVSESRPCHSILFRFTVFASSHPTTY